MDDYRIRMADVRDAGIIAAHRVAMFREMGLVTTEPLAAELEAASCQVLEGLLRSGDYVGWLALDSLDAVIAGAGAHVKSQLPRPSQNRRFVDSADLPLAVNVYTEVAWRQRGIARTLMLTLMAWARNEGFDRIILHASDAGRPLYDSLGFKSTNEMSWTVAGA